MPSSETTARRSCSPAKAAPNYLARALADGPFRRVRHRGNHRYVLLPPAHALRRKIVGAFPTLDYPKRTDPPPDNAPRPRVHEDLSQTTHEEVAA